MGPLAQRLAHGVGETAQAAGETPVPGGVRESQELLLGPVAQEGKAI